jgi:PIN domain nuclease of toxin-antitoxin system
VDVGKALAFVPTAVAIELSLLAEARRKVPTVAGLGAALRANDALRILPQDFDQAKEFALLGALKDPFDRMIVAAARVTKRPLITSDGVIADSGLVEVIWD